MNRRGFLLGLGSVIAAPAIVRVENIMVIKPVRYTIIRTGLPTGTWRLLNDVYNETQWNGGVLITRPFVMDLDEFKKELL